MAEMVGEWFFVAGSSDGPGGLGFTLAVGLNIAYDSYVVGYFSIAPLALLQYNWSEDN